MAKDVSTGKRTTIYDANEALSGMKAPTVKDREVNKFEFEFEISKYVGHHGFKKFCVHAV